MKSLTSLSRQEQTELTNKGYDIVFDHVGYTYHLVCLNNSYYSNAYALYAVWAFAVITPTGKKGGERK